MIEPYKNGEKTGYVFRAVGQVIAFPGFLEVYIEGKDLGEEENGEGILPELKQGDDLKEEKVESSQHFTKPPARYTEASLVKKLESEGIGRPSTYAPTISTIIARGYIKKEAKLLHPTDVASVVTDLLVKNFPDIVDYKFTAEMEEKLDKIEEEKLEWIPMLKAFYDPFHKNILDKTNVLKKEDIVNEKSDEKCEKCGQPMVIKLGRFGKFLSCSNYPKCKNAKPLEGHERKLNPEDEKDVENLKEKFKNKKCEKCGKLMQVRVGRYGPFLGCTGYPKCKNIVSLTVFSGVKCPECKEGQLVEKRTRKGARVFWGCNKFPKCKFASWDRPVEMCKKCGHLIVENKEGKKRCLQCDKKEEKTEE
jgi:DNA topoisomerase-1